MMDPIKLVARFRDGRVLKGTTDQFNPLTGGFHLHPEPASRDGSAVPVRLAELKAVFIVHDFAGRPGQEGKRRLRPKQAMPGDRLHITFSDGEVIIGHSLHYDPSGPGFYLFPAERDSNNQRIFVVNGAVRDVRHVA